MTPNDGRRTFGAVLLSTLVLLSSSPRACAQDAAPPLQQLDEARRTYAEGRVAEARALLQALLAVGPELPRPVRLETLAYLGDILYSEQGKSAADTFFNALLDEDPDYRMDPLEHPEEVVRYFDGLRPVRKPLDVVVVRPKPPGRGPFPYLALAPGGLYYFVNGTPGAGLVVAGTQAALLVTNLVLYQQIRAINAAPGGGTAETEWHQLELATNLAAGALYVSLVVPPAVEVGRWGSVAPAARVTLAPGALTVSGTF
ncbi:MAG: hypothetical protein EXR71_02185 [Myxococcales bacterium]|nr:hypothetical protein [Myxococcales bacterium]